MYSHLNIVFILSSWHLSKRTISILRPSIVPMSGATVTDFWSSNHFLLSSINRLSSNVHILSHAYLPWLMFPTSSWAYYTPNYKGGKIYCPKFHSNVWDISPEYTIPTRPLTYIVGIGLGMPHPLLSIFFIESLNHHHPIN